MNSVKKTEAGRRLKREVQQENKKSDIKTRFPLTGSWYSTGSSAPHIPLLWTVCLQVCAHLDGEGVRRSECLPLFAPLLTTRSTQKVSDLSRGNTFVLLLLPKKNFLCTLTASLV